jgi:hypothetical protein
VVSDLENQRCTVHRVIPGNYDAPRRGVRTTVFGEKRARHQVPVARSWTDNLQHISTRTVRVENNELPG